MAECLKGLIRKFTRRSAFRMAAQEFGRIANCKNKSILARSRLYQRRFLRPRPHFSAFFKLYIFSFAPFQISVIFQAFAPFFAKFWRSFCKISNKTADFANFRQISTDFVRNFSEFLQSLEKSGKKRKKPSTRLFSLKNSEYSAFLVRLFSKKAATLCIPVASLHVVESWLQS